MGKEPVPDVPAMTRFFREVIGCNCPDEVLRHIEVQRGSSAVKACSAIVNCASIRKTTDHEGRIDSWVAFC
jgi:hypothetical protein